MLAQDRVTPEPEMVDYWDFRAPKYAAQYLGSSNEARAFQIRLKRVIDLFDKPKGKVLDIGCGPGVTVDFLSQEGCDVHGVDISEQMVDECKVRFADRPNAHFSTGRIENLDFADASFDAVLSMGVVEYIVDDKKAVAEMARVTKPGGTVIITVPNRRSPYRIWDRLVFRIAAAPVKKLIGRDPRGVAHKEYVASKYCKVLEDAGLEVTDVEYYAFKIILSPFDGIFRWLTAVTGARLEFLYRGPLGWLGTGFIVKAVKG
ncbi:MAG: methyltransferase domain-containing protein [Chloroflexi bacterium]|nr:methyltransferase domain-containing protein [Chloroflexota bacterium]MCI0822583.1 methyltransferase domain-containing protein [Chloroflexota bacterium]MCI0868274.1 methyltransferase domain-containing protein [Chloroflexota bacterium]